MIIPNIGLLPAGMAELVHEDDQHGLKPRLLEVMLEHGFRRAIFRFATPVPIASHWEGSHDKV